jgi:signal transduction histidine kinase
MGERNFAEAQGMEKFDLETRLKDSLAELAKANEKLQEETSKRKEVEHALEEMRVNYALLLDYANEAANIIQKMREEIQNNILNDSRKGAVVRAFLHDLKGPLALISSCTQFIMESANLESSLAENLKIIYESSQRANTLILKFLELITSKNLTFKPVNINEIISKMWRLARLDTRAFQVSFDAQLSSDLPRVVGNEESLERVFYNLFMNAIQALSKKGKVIVRTQFRPEEKMVEISVIDDGPGIPLKDRQKIFEPFFTTKAEGTGLGLAICRSIIQQHLGTIHLILPEGGGTHFSIKLPVSA